MQAILLQKLRTYITDNHPDLLIKLQEENKLTLYLQEKVEGISTDIEQWQEMEAPAYVIEDICMDLLTEDLKPSRFNYILSILMEDFSAQYDNWAENGVLKYEAIHLIQVSEPLFEVNGFTAATENNPILRNAVVTTIRNYINN